jgi:opacity protein-like surface antigen
LVAAALFLLVPARPATAQITGWATFHIGQTTGGDTTESGAAFGVSLAAFENDGWMGADVDVSHSTAFNDERFADSSLTTVMANVIFAPSAWRMQPYLLAGAGAIRVRACEGSCATTLGRTEFGLDAGGGFQYRFSDIVAVRGEMRYFRVVSEIEDLPRTNSGNFDFFRVSAGVTLMWAQQ